MPKIKDVMAVMEEIAPHRLAEVGDQQRIGLHCGDPEARVTKVALALDASLVAVKAAVKLDAEMLLVHHPRFYGGIRNLVDSDVAGRRGVALIKAGLAVFSAHTNLDVAPGGTNDLLAAAAGLNDTDVIVPVYSEQLLKLAVFVPATHVSKVMQALDKSGAGAIGNYSACTFRSRGVGTFRCGEEANPFQGQPGSFEEADEFRLETVFMESLKDRVIAAMVAAHPYEEVAYDIYSLLGKGKVYGFGRVGSLDKPESVASLTQRLAKHTLSTQAQYSGTAGRKVKRVAVWAGGGVAVEKVIASGADAVVVGEIGYHDIETFSENSVAVIVLGHGFSEEIVLRPLAQQLEQALPGVEFKVAGVGFISLKNI